MNSKRERKERRVREEARRKGRGEREREREIAVRVRERERRRPVVSAFLLGAVTDCGRQLATVVRSALVGGDVGRRRI